MPVRHDQGVWQSNDEEEEHKLGNQKFKANSSLAFIQYTRYEGRQAEINEQ